MDSRRTIDIFKRKRPHTGASFLVYFREDAGMGLWICLQSQIVKIHLIRCEQLGLSLVAGKEDNLSLKGL